MIPKGIRNFGPRQIVAGGYRVLTDPYALASPRQASHTFTNAEIKALRSEVHIFVPAPLEAYQVVVPISFILVSDFVDAYDDIDATSSMALCAGETDDTTWMDVTGGAESGNDQMTPIFTATGRSFALFKLPASDGVDRNIISGAAALYENVPLALVTSNSTDFTGGNAANTMIITVEYRLFNTQTGLFE